MIVIIVMIIWMIYDNNNHNDKNDRDDGNDGNHGYDNDDDNDNSDHNDYNSDQKIMIFQKMFSQEPLFMKNLSFLIYSYICTQVLICLFLFTAEYYPVLMLSGYNIIVI